MNIPLPVVFIIGLFAFAFVLNLILKHIDWTLRERKIQRDYEEAARRLRRIQ